MRETKREIEVERERERQREEVMEDRDFIYTKCD